MCTPQDCGLDIILFVVVLTLMVWQEIGNSADYSCACLEPDHSVTAVSVCTHVYVIRQPTSCYCKHGYEIVSTEISPLGGSKVGVGGRELIETDEPRRGSTSSRVFRDGVVCSNHASISR